MRGDVADEAAQVLLGIPVEVAQDEAERFGEIGGAADAGAAHQRLPPLEQGQRRGGGQDDFDGGFTRAEGFERAVGRDAELERQRPQHEARALAGEGSELRARPGRGGEQVVQRLQDGQVEHE
ncbi:MAG: hypothetical protein IPH73_05600 [Rhodocyclales bacterium]|nr:hypothetical protein [Rhodocyclales bacterium]